MIGLVVTGHGHFADGIHTSAQMIAGENEYVRYINFEEDATGKHNAGTDLHVRMDFAKLLALIAHILGRDSIQDESNHTHNDCQCNAGPKNYFPIDHCLDSVAFIRFGFFGRSL